MHIVWFRQDLRLHDNPALTHAAQQGGDILPLYILDDESADEWQMGGASRWWLHHSLHALNQSLDGNLQFFKGNPADIFDMLSHNHDIQGIYWNRCYEPWRIARDTALKSDLITQGNLDVLSFNAHTLFEPTSVLKKDRTPYKVFTPYYRKGCLTGAQQPNEPIPKPTALAFATCTESCDLNDLGLLPDINWYTGMETCWQPGEVSAYKRFSNFLEDGLQGYKDGRNFPDKPHVSRLSPHLHFGEISPRHIWHETQTAMHAHHLESDGDHFLSEMGWREFSTYLLYHFPELPHQNLQSKFDRFPWEAPQENDALTRWQRGMTGYPIVDAGMRELWQTGYMHNRVRMIVGSFLVKHLRIDWRHGAAWFWDTLVDADLANNSASWQWIAGCGADAAPYFRIFNPTTQGTKFDPDGSYTKRYVPELSKLPNRYLFEPWKAPDEILAHAGIALGKDYPLPIVDHSAAREEALASFSSLKTSG